MTHDTAFQWNLGGWLGGQLGSTCWILVASLMAFPQDPRVGAVVLALFVVPNVVGWRLWAARERIAPLRSLQIMVLLAGVFGAGTVRVLDDAGRSRWRTIETPGVRVNWG